jgi:outer membrane murein-binding lipoprotein Lpp
MKRILVFVIGLSSTAVLYGATIVAGCVTDAKGKPVAGAKVFAAPERGDKTYRAETRKSDGCYEMKIAKDGVYRVGVRDVRFGADGPVQRYITVSGLDLPKIDLSTDVPNAKLLTQRVADAVLSASEAFARVRRGVGGGAVPVVTAEVPSGFDNCMLQSSNDQNGPTASWWCSTGGGLNGIRDEHAVHAMFESIRDSITTALGNLHQLRYSPMKIASDLDRAVWVSPINGVVALSHIKGEAPGEPYSGTKKRNVLVLWAAYNSRMTDEGCASIQKNEEAKVDFAKYDSTVNAMRDEYGRQVKAAFRAALRNLLGAAVAPALIGSEQQSGVAGGSVVSPNACLKKTTEAAREYSRIPLATEVPITAADTNPSASDRVGSAPSDQQSPNLTGRWTLVSESNSGMPSPKSVEIQVEGSAVKLRSNGGDQAIYYTDGRPTVYKSGVNISGAAHWKNGVLVIRIDSTGVAQTFDYSISTDGRALTRQAKRVVRGGILSENTAIYSKSSE